MTDKPEPLTGVSIDFFTGAIRILGRIYPNRATGPALNGFVDGLRQAEECYRNCEQMPPKPKKRKPKTRERA